MIEDASLARIVNKPKPGLEASNGILFSRKLLYKKKPFAQTNLAEKTLTWTLQIHHLAVIFCHYFILIYDTVQGRSGSIIIRLFGNTIFTFASRSRR